MHNRNELAKLIETHLTQDSKFCIIDEHQFNSSAIILQKVTFYIDWLERHSIQTVMLHCPTDVEIICLVYAVVLSNRTYLPIHLTTSNPLLSQYLDTLQPELLISYSFIQQHQPHADYALCVDKQLPLPALVRKSSQPSFCFLPGIALQTTGSTGSPKSVLMGYPALASYVKWVETGIGYQQLDKLLLTPPMSFLGSVRLLFTAVMTESTLVLPVEIANSPYQNLYQNLMNQPVTCLALTPSVLNGLMAVISQSASYDAFSAIRLITLTGEPYDVTVIEKWFQQINPNTTFHCIYGGTEFSVLAVKVITLENIKYANGDLGTVRQGMGYKLLACPGQSDKQLAVKGEIAIGYLDRRLTDLNYRMIDGERYFLSSDLVELKAERLYLKGRLERTIKRNGHLVNLSSIEAVCKKHYKVAAIVDPACDNNILLYIEASPDQNIIIKLTELLNKTLPGYMVPTHYLFMAQLPVNNHGKLNYDMIEKLVRLKQSQRLKLFLQKFSVDFAKLNSIKISSLGLESIDYIELASIIFQETGRWIKMDQNLDNQTIGDVLDQASEGNQSASDTTLSDSVQLNSYHKYMYNSQLENHLMPTKLTFYGYYPLAEDIDINKLEQAILSLRQRHFALQCRLGRKGNNYYLVRTKPAEAVYLRPIKIRPWQSLPKKTINMHSPQLVYIFLQQINSKWHLVMGHHHVALDGWSSYMLRHELFNLYQDTPASSTATIYEQIQRLNHIYHAPKPNKISLKDIIPYVCAVEAKNYNQLSMLFNKNPEANNSTIYLSYSEVQKYKAQNGLNEIPDNSFFVLVLYSVLSQLSERDKMSIFVALSNRHHQIPDISHLLGNMNTGLPLYLSRSTQSLQKFGNKITDALEVYAKHMDFTDITSIAKTREYAANMSQNRLSGYRLSYSYLNLYQESVPLDKYIDWQNHQIYMTPFDEKHIIFRVAKIGHKVLIILDSKMNKGLHKKFVANLKSILPF